MKEVSVVSTTKQSCEIYALLGHPEREFPTIPAFKEVLMEQSSAIFNFKKPYFNPYSETYNSGWRNHQIFSWKNTQPVSQQLGPPSGQP